MGENILEKEENAGHQHFFLFPKCFQKPFFFKTLEKGLLKITMNKMKLLITYCANNIFSLASSIGLSQSGTCGRRLTKVAADSPRAKLSSLEKLYTPIKNNVYPLILLNLKCDIFGLLNPLPHNPKF